MARIVYAVAGEGPGRPHLIGQRFIDAGMT
jgi:hypothetical protein